MSKDINVELPIDDESLEEDKAQQMPVGTEADSVKSVDKAEDGVKKQASARKGDKLSAKDEPSGKPSPKTKAGIINAMFTKMNGMKTAELGKMYSSYHEDVDLEELEEIEETSYDFDADLKALVESEATLSDEFKAKTAIIFETAVKSKITEEVSRLEDEYQQKLDEEISAQSEDLVEKVDNYLNYVVETWMEENKLAVETGLRTEIAEGFMNSLKDLFVESYIDVPESKVDLVDELSVSVEELEEKLNQQTGAVIEMTQKLEAYQREAIVREHSRDLADTQVEKLMSLVSSLDFEDEESFTHKVMTVNRDLSILQPAQRPYFADVLLGNPKPMRDIFYTLLKKNNLLNSCLVNLFDEYKSSFLNSGTQDIDVWFKDNNCTTDEIEGHFASQYISKHIYENTWISVVAESQHSNEFFFPTEKTGKALFAKRPFIVLSGQYYLRTLRSLGFRTFNSVIDESYDDIEDYTQRTYAAFESYKKLMQMDQNVVREQLSNVLEHNHKLLCDKKRLNKDAQSMLENLATDV